MEHRSQHGLTAGNFPHVDNAKKCRRHVFHEVPVGVLEFSEICSRKYCRYRRHNDGFELPECRLRLDRNQNTNRRQEAALVV